ncbi:MAG: hypothetical protein KIT14_01010 [bacterium]|nr:hypothetical protein [bacterium]
MLRLLIPLLALLLLAARGDAATFTVTVADDAGEGSLRAAITAANDETTNPGPDSIAFALPGDAVPTITLSTPLPEITAPVVIDGTTQPTSRLVEITGAGAVANGLVVTGGGSTLRGLIVNRFSQAGLVLQTPGGGSTIEGCFIGTDAGRLTGASPAMPTGILVDRSGQNRIGGASTTARNVIAGNQVGLRVTGTTAADNVVEGNYVGLAANGLTAIGNTSRGIVLAGGARRTRIGSTNAAGRNVVSQNWAGTNTGVGIEIVGPTTQENTVLGNFIGTDASGVQRRLNGAGIVIDQAVNNLIGGTTAAERNVISGNEINLVINSVGGQANRIFGNWIGPNALDTGIVTGNGTGIRVSLAFSPTRIGGLEPGAGNVIVGHSASGIFLTGNASNQRIEGNQIGLRPNGTSIGGNVLNGVSIQGSNNVVAGNLIAHNGQIGVAVDSGTGNTIRSNRIYSNTGLAIDLAPLQVVNPNDDGDADTGPNDLQNFPVLNAVVPIGATTAGGTLSSTPNTTFTIDVYLNPACDPSGHGEATQPFGSVQTTTNAGGVATFVVPLAEPVPPGQVLTATATAPNGSTSELSACTNAAASTTTTTVVTTSTTRPPGSTTTTTKRPTTTVGPTTTTTTTLPGPPTTTTTIPEVCGDRIDNDGDGYVDCDDLDCFGHPACLAQGCTDAPTVAAVICRLDEQRTVVASAADLGTAASPVASRLDKARAALVGAQGSCALGKRAPTRRRLAQSRRLLRTAEAQLRKRAPRAGVSPLRIDVLAAGLRPVQERVNVLRQSIVCPGG